MWIQKTHATLVGAALLFAAASIPSEAGALTREATCRKVQGVITAVDTTSMSISPKGRPTVTGRIDQRTKVMIDGHAGHPADLQVTYNAKGQLCLDDVWTVVTADTH